MPVIVVCERLARRAYVLLLPGLYKEIVLQKEEGGREGREVVRT